ncbi:hypothetical protein K402DRAFT_419229 [Aulographum hederae CBS 113979]|uniref:Clr5 domain-containing protein n=1 Tax=Aulographum hederae CBS 113979 TaxID=1176131 RepID=A0A6G1H7E7_9PEZI|nr:hypothetical protein K402DRAFT_419229 [Aulographum hederae CBS 113979]
MADFSVIQYTGSSSRAKRIAPVEWERRKAELHQLYICENRTVKEILDLMETTPAFSPSDKQYVEQFKRWNFTKYLIKPKPVPAHHSRSTPQPSTFMESAGRARSPAPFQPPETSKATHKAGS